MSITDHDLIRRVLATSDHYAFSVLVRRHQSQVRALLRRLCAGDTATADDIAQEVFLRAYQNLHRFRAEAKFSSWLYRIAYNTYVSHMRQNKAPGGEACDASSDIPSIPGPPSLARHDLHRAMGALKAEERAALALTYATDHTHEEAARVLGWPLGTLKTHIARGKEKLRRRLGAWHNEAVV